MYKISEHQITLLHVIQKQTFCLRLHFCAWQLKYLTHFLSFTSSLPGKNNWNYLKRPFSIFLHFLSHSVTQYLLQHSIWSSRRLVGKILITFAVATCIFLFLLSKKMLTIVKQLLWRAGRAKKSLQNLTFLCHAQHCKTVASIPVFDNISEATC